LSGTATGRGDGGTGPATTGRPAVEVATAERQVHLEQRALDRHDLLDLPTPGLVGAQDSVIVAAVGRVIPWCETASRPVRVEQPPLAHDVDDREAGPVLSESG
jgi:hypothetical protein